MLIIRLLARQRTLAGVPVQCATVRACGGLHPHLRGSPIRSAPYIKFKDTVHCHWHVNVTDDATPCTYTTTTVVTASPGSRRTAPRRPVTTSNLSGTCLRFKLGACLYPHVRAQQDLLQLSVRRCHHLATGINPSQPPPKLELVVGSQCTHLIISTAIPTAVPHSHPGWGEAVEHNVPAPKHTLLSE